MAAYLEELQQMGISGACISVISRKKVEYQQKLLSTGKLYEEWFEKSKPAFVVAHGDESVQQFLTYILNVKKYAPSTMWTFASYVKDYVGYCYSVPRAQMIVTKSFLKSNSSGYAPKKASTLTFREYEEYWADPDEEKNALGLLRKCLSLCGYYAADRSTAFLRREDVEIVPEKNQVEITTTKRKGDKVTQIHMSFQQREDLILWQYFSNISISSTCHNFLFLQIPFRKTTIHSTMAAYLDDSQMFWESLSHLCL